MTTTIPRTTSGRLRVNQKIRPSLRQTQRENGKGEHAQRTLFFFKVEVKMWELILLSVTISIKSVAFLTSLE